MTYSTNFYNANGIKTCPNGDKVRSRPDGTLFCPGEADVVKAEAAAGETTEEEKPKSTSRRKKVSGDGENAN